MSGLNQIIAAFSVPSVLLFIQSAWERDILYFIRRMSCMVRVSFGRTHHPTVWETIFCSGIIFRIYAEFLQSGQKVPATLYLAVGMIP